MSAARCKLLMSYLPGIAAVVNSFQSPEVQLAVYQTLISALDDRLAEASAPVRAPVSPSYARSRPLSPSDTEIAHDLVEGDSIHALVE